MRAAREIRRAFNALRRRHAGKNGVIYAGMLDIPWLERREAMSAKLRIRRKAEMRKSLEAARPSERK